MNFKYFCVLITTQLLSECWSVLGQLEYDTDDLSEENAKVLNGLPKDIPLDIINVRDRLSILKWRMRYLRSGVVSRRKENNKLIDELAVKDYTIYNTARAVEIPSWIHEIEEEHFPQWLWSIEINRYYKWVIVLLTGAGNFLDNLRLDLKKRGISHRKFAAEMFSAYNKTFAWYAYDLLGIRKPEPSQAETFCKFLQKSNIIVTPYVCEVVIGIAPYANETTVSDSKSTSKSISTSITPKYLTKFFIVITDVTTVDLDFETQLNNIINEIENNSVFPTNECNVIKSYQLPGNEEHNKSHKQHDILHLPGMLFHVEVKMDFEDGKWFEKDLNVRSQINQTLQSVLKDAKICLADTKIYLWNDY